MQVRNNHLMYKRDPCSKKFVLNNSMVFQGGRYRYSGEKYLTISRKNSASDLASRRDSQKSLCRSAKSTRSPTSEAFPIPPGFPSPATGLGSSKKKFDVKVSVASWRITSGKSRDSQTKDNLATPSKRECAPLSRSRLLKTNSKLLISKGLVFRAVRDPIRRGFPSKKSNLNASLDSLGKSKTQKHDRYREQLRGRSIQKLGSEPTSDSLKLR